MRKLVKALLIGPSFLLATLVASPAQAAWIYEWYDDSGNVVAQAVFCQSGNGWGWGTPTANYYAYDNGSYC